MFVKTLVLTSFKLFYLRVIPESPRWLITSKKYKKAEKLIHRIVKMNKIEYPTTTMEAVKEHGLKVNNTRYTIVTLFKTPNLRKRTILMWFLW